MAEKSLFSSKSRNPQMPGVVDISPEELKDKLSEVCLIDVRRPDEYQGELGHIPGARLLTLDTLPSQVQSLPTGQPIVFVCRSGGRSAQATAFAQQNGFSDVYNMQGGMLLWNELGLEIKKDPYAPTP